MHLVAALLQNPTENPNPMFGTGLLVGIIVAWCFVAFCLQTIAKKTNTDNGWFAWIPILNYVLMVKIAKKPVWWVLLFFVPLVNFVIIIIVLAGMCEARGKSPWLTVALILPVVNIFGLAYLAFAD